MSYANLSKRKPIHTYNSCPCPAASCHGVICDNARSGPLNLIGKSSRRISQFGVLDCIDKSLSPAWVEVSPARKLAIIGYEWIIVLVIVVVLFVWGPQKLPEFARSIGLARKEIDKAYKEATNPPSSQPSQETDALIETAKKLGISTEGKTKAQISDEIVKAKNAA